MSRFENIWTFKTARFAVHLDVAWEDFPDMSWADAETLDKIERGVWGVYVFRVRVMLDGREIAADYLGNSVYESVSDFRDHFGVRAKSRAEGCNYGSYFSDMVAEAVAQARSELRSMQAVRIRAA
jgi:hypothetical protein